MRRLACSDIHGCARQLEAVLRKARYRPGRDQLYLLGDYIDRGPEIPRTVAMVRELQQQGAIVLAGNHDAACASWRPDWQQLWLRPGNGAAHTLLQYGGSVPEDVREWMASLPLYHEKPDVLFVHAGMRPGVALADQDPHDLLWIREEFWTGYHGPRTVIFGHTPTILLHGEARPWFGDCKINIDTGAVFAGQRGGCLTLMDVDSLRTWTA